MVSVIGVSMTSLEWQMDDVKASLKPLSWQVGCSHSDATMRYLSHYGLDLTADLSHVSHEVGYFDAHGFRLVAHVFQQPQASGTVLVQHGYYDHVGLYTHVIKHCLEQGYNVFAYDMPGHGLSTGDRASIRSFQQYDQVFEHAVGLCQTHLKEPISLVGQSTGGAVIINYVLSRHINRTNSPFQQIYLLAPLIRPVAWRMSLIFYYLVSPFIKQLKRAFSENSNNPKFVEFVARHDPLQPMYLKTNWVRALKEWIPFIENCPPVDMDIHIIQGNEDATVDFRHNIKVLSEKFLGQEVSFIEGGRHHLANEEPRRLKQVLNCIAL